MYYFIMITCLPVTPILTGVTGAATTAIMTAAEITTPFTNHPNCVSIIT